MTDPSPPATSARELVHRALREQLGRYATGQLGDVESGAIASHLECCASCRAELPAAPPRASAVPVDDATSVDEVPVERHVRRRGAASGVLAGAAAVLVLAVGLGMALGVVVGPQLVAPREVIRTVTLPPPAPTATPVTPEPTDAAELIRWAETGVDVTSMSLVSQPWGLEVRVEGSGFVADEVYRTVVRSKRGRDLPAGEFLGTGDATLRAVLHAAVPRDGASGFSILDARGVPVAQSRFPAT